MRDSLLIILEFTATCMNEKGVRTGMRVTPEVGVASFIFIYFVRGMEWNGMEFELFLSTDSSIIDLGIITYGVGTQNSSLTIPGNPELNNTIVTCIASGLVDMMGYLNTSNATLFIQGIIICIMLLYIG